jgi:hypothetical protein
MVLWLRITITGRTGLVNSRWAEECEEKAREREDKKEAEKGRREVR